MPISKLGVTDLWTTDPHIAKLLVDKTIGHSVTRGSHKKADFQCPYCGSVIKQIVIRKVTKTGLRCPICSDGISYPEKFMSILLSELNLTYKYDSCLFKNCRYRYDFYIEDLSLIIETHGKQHYDKNCRFAHSSYRDEMSNDKDKKDFALKQGIKHYIELDCSVSSVEHIVNSINNSSLPTLLNLNEIDYNSIHRKTFSSNVIKVCELYKSNHNTNEIASMLHLDRSTVCDYLHRCADAGLCDYTGEYRRKIICVDTGIVYNNLKEISDLGFNASQVSECCNNSRRAKTAGGYNWCYLDEYDSKTYQMKKPKNNNTPKRVLCIETGKIYEKLSDVRNDGFNPTLVSQICHKKRKTNRGCTFAFI